MSDEFEPYSRAAREFMCLLASAASSNDYYLAAVARALLRRTLIAAERDLGAAGVTTRERVTAMREVATPWLAAPTIDPPPVPDDCAGVLGEIQRYLQRAKPIFLQAHIAFPFLVETKAQDAPFADTARQQVPVQEGHSVYEQARKPALPVVRLAQVPRSSTDEVGRPASDSPQRHRAIRAVATGASSD